ncbi:MAG: hypothetical protein K6T65_10435 [Peptococcaceae bacterium]|nr:hypothetical protein [Peptococcaceae bacterium]
MKVHSGEHMDVYAWRWEGDERVFLVPLELFEKGVGPSGLARDVISWAAQAFRDEHFPDDRNVYSSGKKIAESIGLAWNGRNCQAIDDVIGFARYFTIQNYRVVKKVNKKGEVIEEELVNFGFFDETARIGMRNGVRYAPNRRPYRIQLSSRYADAVKNFPPAPVPVAALEAAHAAPWRVQDAVKNIAYHLAARVPAQEVRLLVSTLQEIMLLSGSRMDKTRKAIENVLSTLYPVMVKDYQFSNGGYNILLSGKDVKK